MSPATDLHPTFRFLAELRKHNNREWFEKHRDDYEDAQGRFEALVNQIIAGLSPVDDLAGLQAKDCVMRIFRDVRFSKDKSPYKTNMAANISPGGRKSHKLGYHLSLAPGGESIIAGGIYMPEPAQLNRLRDAIARDAAPLKALAQDKNFKKYFGQLEGEKVKTFPQGYDRDHPDIELLKFKQFLAIHRLPDEVVLGTRFAAHAIKVCAAMRPFNEYLNGVLK
jgi:uncharacterized protein (TIGR02453 family)